MEEKQILIDYLSQNGFSKESAALYINSLLKNPDEPTNLKFSAILELVKFTLNLKENKSSLKTIIVEDTVYQVSDKEYENILDVQEEANRLPFGGDLHVDEYLHFNKKNYEKIGEVDLDFSPLNLKKRCDGRKTYIPYLIYSNDYFRTG